MRQLTQNFLPGDRLELSLAVTAEVTANEPVNDGRLLNLRVVGLQNRSNGKEVLWSSSRDGVIELAVEVGANQRLLAVGLSARQREKLKARFAGLTAAEAGELLEEIADGATRKKRDDGDSVGRFGDPTSDNGGEASK